MKKYSCLAAVLLAVLVLVPSSRAEDKKLKPYTLKTCVVSGDKLGEMGEPYKFEYEGREIKFCCKSCVKDFKKDPAKYLKKIDEAEAKQAKEGKAEKKS